MSPSMTAMYGLSLSLAHCTWSSVMFSNVHTRSRYFFADVVVGAGGSGKKHLWNVLLFSSSLILSDHLPLSPPSSLGCAFTLCLSGASLPACAHPTYLLLLFPLASPAMNFYHLLYEFTIGSHFLKIAKLYHLITTNLG